MKFTEALEKIRVNYRISMSRKAWPFDLYFDGKSGYLMISSRDELTPYTISEFDFDFDYEWEVK